MRVEDAERNLRDYLVDGFTAELFWADEAYALAAEISQRVEQLRATTFERLFGSLHVILSDRQTLSITKIFEPENPRYPTRSIPAVLGLLETNAGLWRMPERRQLHQVLADTGQDVVRLGRLSKAELTRTIVVYYRSTLPRQDRVNSSRLSLSLDVLRQSRDKVIAHNASVEKAALQMPTWGEATSLVNYVKDFVTTIGFGYLSIDFGLGRDGDRLTHDARRTSSSLRRLLKAAGLAEGLRY